MKTVRNLQKTTSEVSGSIKITIDKEGTELTIKKCLLDSLNLAKKVTALEAVRAWDLYKKLKEYTEDSIDIDDQDKELLLRVIEERDYIVPIKAALAQSIG